MKTKIYCIVVLAIFSYLQANAQKNNITGDTIFVNTDEELQIKFPSDKLESRWTSLNPPYIISYSPNSIFLHAKNDTAKCSNLSVFEGPGPRNHSFIICYQKDVSKVIYDYSTAKKLQQRVKEIEDRDAAKKAAATVAAANTANPSNTNSTNYYAMLEEGDKAFKNGRLDEAQAKYEQVLRLQSDNEFAKKGLNNVKDKKAEKQKEFDDKIALLKSNANKAFSDKQYEEALKGYNAALAMKPDDLFSKSQIETIQKIKSENELAVKQAKAQHDQFVFDSTINELKTKAEKAYGEKRYDDAITAYANVLKLNPIDIISERRIEAIQKIKSQFEERKKGDENFKTVVASADKAFSDSNFEVARAMYLSAKELRPDEKSIESKLQITNEKMLNKQNEDEYNMAVSAGDKALKALDYGKAKTEYAKAFNLFKDRLYPSDKINEINKITSDIAAKQNQEKEEKDRKLESINKYNSVIEKADKALQDSDYDNASMIYAQAASFKPDNDYAKSKLGEIENLKREKKARADSMVTSTEADQKYSLVMAKAKAAFDKKDYKNAKISYTRASELKPTQQEPKDKLELIYKQLNPGLVNAQYDSAIAKGNMAIADKNYTVALENFKEALRLKRGETFPINQIRYIRQLITSDSLQQAEKQRVVELKVAEEIRIKRFREGISEHTKYEKAAQVSDYELELFYLKRFLNIIPASELSQYQGNPEQMIEDAKTKIQQIREELTKRKGSTYQAEAIPYLDIELEKKYENINFTALPDGQLIDTMDNTLHNEYNNRSKEILSEKPAFSLADSSGNVKLICQSVSVKKDEVFYKFRIQNTDTAEFLTGAMRLTLFKKDGNTINNNPNYISSFPIVLPGREFYIVYGTKDLPVNNEDTLLFEMNDRQKKRSLKISIPGVVSNREKKEKL